MGKKISLIFMIFFSAIFVAVVFYEIDKYDRASGYTQSSDRVEDSSEFYEDDSISYVGNVYYKKYESSNDKGSDKSSNYKYVNWNLSSLFTSDESWQAELDRFSKDISELENYIGKATKSKTHFISALKVKEELDRRLERLYAYARLNKDINKNSYKYLNMVDDVMKVDYKYSKITSELELEILKLSDSTYEQYLKSNKLSKKYKTYLDEVRKSKAHYLDKNSEGILSKLGVITSLPANIYDLFINMDKNNKNTASEYSSDVKSYDRDTRKEAYTNEFIPYNDNINTLSGLLIGQVNKNAFYANVRNYSSAREMYLEGDNIGVDVYENLIDTVNKNIDKLHRYISIRKKLLNIDKVHYYDMQAPIVEEANSDVSYDNAISIVYAALAPLGNEYEDVIYKAVNERWIDVYSEKNKVSGGYCMSVYDNHPYILLNYDNSLASVSTLVHELGHGVYGYLSQKNQSYYNSKPSVFTHEVASTTNEALLYEYLIKNSEDDKHKAYYISQYLDFIKDTLYIQTMYAEFEKEIHSLVENNENINALVLNDLWKQLLIKYYGEDFEVDPLAMIGWSRIPHFYNSFYVYKYATGCSSAIAFSQDIIKNGPDNYIKFLKKGNSENPLNLLKESGVDLSSNNSIQLALDKFNELLSQLDELTNN